MTFETEAIISLLKHSGKQTVSHETIKNEARIPSDTVKKLIRKLQYDGLVNLQAETVDVDTGQRLKLAIKAVNSGADLERVTRLLSWQEFEGIAAFGFEQNMYKVSRNLHFKQTTRRWEIDVVAYKKPLAICADCKHWKHGLSPSVSRRVAREQAERTSALADALPNPKIKLDCRLEELTLFVPMILSLIAPREKFYDGVPIVPVLQLQDFLNELPGHLESLRHYHRRPGSFKVLG